MSEIGQKIIAAVRQRAAVNPDYVYPSEFGCVNIKDGQPSCLIGCGLWDAGVIDGTLSRHLSESGIYTINEELGLNLDYFEFQWLELVQNTQDSGSEWAVAVQYADDNIHDE